MSAISNEVLVVSKTLPEAKKNCNAMASIVSIVNQKAAKLHLGLCRYSLALEVLDSDLVCTNACKVSARL